MTNFSLILAPSRPSQPRTAGAAIHRTSRAAERVTKHHDFSALDAFDRSVAAGETALSVADFPSHGGRR